MTSQSYDVITIMNYQCCMSHSINPMISQPIVVQFASSLAFCHPKIKVFNRLPIHFCPKLNRLAAILKNCLFDCNLSMYIHNVKPTISQPIVVRLSSGLIFCKPMMKVFNRLPIHFCPKVNRLAAILKNCVFSW